MHKKKISNFFCSLILLLICGITLSLFSNNESYACGGGYGDCDVMYRCDETYSMNTNWCYPTDATLECKPGTNPPECECVCPPGGCTECGAANDGASTSFDCATPMIILDKIMSVSGAGTLGGTVNMHYEKPFFVSSCGDDNFKYNFFTLYIPYPCGFTGPITDPRIKWCDWYLPPGKSNPEKKDGRNKSSSFTIRASGDAYKAQRIGINKYYAVVPKESTEEFNGGVYTKLKVSFSEQLKRDKWNIGEFDEDYFDNYTCNTNLGTDYCVWRNLKLCEEYNDVDNSDGDYWQSFGTLGNHGDIIGDVWTALGIVGATAFAGPAVLWAAPLLLVAAMEDDTLKKQEYWDEDRKCYNTPLMYNQLWDNYKIFLETGSFPTCDQTGRSGYCLTDPDTARSGLVIPIASPTPFYAHSFSTYKGGAYYMNVPPVTTFTTSDTFEYFNPEIDITLTSGEYISTTSMVANSSLAHDHDATYNYQLRFQTEAPDNFFSQPKLCLYSCRRSEDSPTYCINETKSLYELIVSEPNDVTRDRQKAKYLVDFDNSNSCIDFPSLSAAEGHEIKITSLYSSPTTGKNSYEDPVALVEVFNDTVLTLSYEVPLYERTTDAACDIVTNVIAPATDTLNITDKRKRINRECQLASVFQNDLDYVNYPTISFNSSDYMKFFMFYNNDLLSFDEDNSRSVSYVTSKDLINILTLESDIDSFINFYDQGENGGDNTPQKYCESYFLDTDINATDCSKYDGFNITCDYDSCSGGTDSGIKSSTAFSNLICFHGLLRNNRKTYSGTGGFYDMDEYGNSYLSYSTNATSEFMLHPYALNDTTGLISNDYYDYAIGAGQAANNNLCFPMPYLEPELTFVWTSEDPNDPRGTIHFVNSQLSATQNIYIDNLANGGSGIINRTADFRFDFYNRYHITSQNDNGIVYLNVYRYDLPTDSTYNPNPILTHLESLNSCPENADSLIAGATLPETESTITTYGNGDSDYVNVDVACAPVNGFDKTVTGRCNAYGAWSTDGTPHNNSCTVLCSAIDSGAGYTFPEYVNTTGGSVDLTGGSCKTGYSQKAGTTHPVTATCTSSSSWSNVTNNCELIQCSFSGNKFLGSTNYVAVDWMNSGSGSPNCQGGHVGYTTFPAHLYYNIPGTITLTASQSTQVSCNQATFIERISTTTYGRRGGSTTTWSNGRSWAGPGWMNASSNIVFSCSATGVATIQNNCKQNCYAPDQGWTAPGYVANSRSTAITTSGCTGGNHERHCNGTCNTGGSGYWDNNHEGMQGC